MEGAAKLETNRALTFVRDSPKACKNDEVRVHAWDGGDRGIKFKHERNNVAKFMTIKP